jgi:hypothetical protein
MGLRGERDRAVFRRVVVSNMKVETGREMGGSERVSMCAQAVKQDH